MYNSLVKDSKIQRTVEGVPNTNTFEDHPVTSYAQEKISQLLQEMGYEVKDEYLIGEKLFDMYLPEINTAIELNGPTHYLNGTKEPAGSSLYIERLLNQGKNNIPQEGENQENEENKSSSDVKLIIIPYYDLINTDELAQNVVFKSHVSSIPKSEAQKHTKLKDYLENLLKK